MKSLVTLIFSMVFVFADCNAQKHLTRFRNSPISSERINDFYFIDELNGWFVENDIYKTNDGGLTWEKYQGFGEGRSIEFMDKDTGIVGNLGGFFLRTTDGGKNWNALLDSNLFDSGACGIAHVGKTFFACGQYFSPARFFTSYDGGKNWVVRKLDTLARGLVDCYFFNELEGLVSGTGLDSTEGFIILKTKDGGKTWKNVFSASGVISYVWKLFPLNDSVLYASMQGLHNGFTYLLKSKNKGESWQLIKTNLTQDKIQGIGFVNENEGWMGGWFSGSLHTQDGGYTWRYQPFGRILNRFFTLPNGELLASGITLYELSELTSTNEINELRLHSFISVFPNPANQYLTVSFNMEFNSFGSFQILNGEGKLLQSSLRKQYLKGKNSENLNIEMLSSGNYHLVFLSDENHIRAGFVVAR